MLYVFVYARKGKGGNHANGVPLLSFCYFFFQYLALNFVHKKDLPESKSILLYSFLFYHPEIF